MHEMSIAQSVLEIVEEQSRSDGRVKGVRVVRLAIGALSHVEPSALAWAFEVVAKGTIAEGARLEIERPRGTAWCARCAQTVEVLAHGEPCPRCGEHEWQMTGGDEMRVVELEVV